jgi:hypothetical protein
MSGVAAGCWRAVAHLDAAWSMWSCTSGSMASPSNGIQGARRRSRRLMKAPATVPPRAPEESAKKQSVNMAYTPPKRRLSRRLLMALKASILLATSRILAADWPARAMP